jgi:hypothetical protein
MLNLAGDDQIIDAPMARSLHADACRNHAAVAWVVPWDLPAYPERYAARLATSTASPYLLLADTLGGIWATLPPSLVRSERMPVDPPEVVEIWFAGLAPYRTRLPPLAGPACSHHPILKLVAVSALGRTP